MSFLGTHSRHHPRFDKNAVTYSRWVAVRILGHHLKVKGHIIDRNGIFPGEVLCSTCQEGLSEEEPTDPEHCRWAIVQPILDRSKEERMSIIRPQVSLVVIVLLPLKP